VFANSALTAREVPEIPPSVPVNSKHNNFIIFAEIPRPAMHLPESDSDRTLSEETGRRYSAYAGLGTSQHVNGFPAKGAGKDL
jgi:hypothetical protein